MLRKKLLRGGAWLSSGNALSAGASFLRNIIIARLVGVEDFGIVVLLTLTLAVFETVSNLSVDRLLVQAPDGDDPKLQATAHALLVVRGVFGGIIVFLAATSIASLFKIPHVAWAFQTLAIIPVIRSLMHLDTVRFQREMFYRPTFWLDALPQAVSLILAVPLAYWLRDYTVIIWAMLGQALTQVIVTHHFASRPYQWNWDRNTVLRILTFGWPLLANGLLMFAIFQGDNALIAVAFNTKVVGWYGAAFMLSMAPATLVTAVMQGLLLPVLSKSQNAPEEFRLRYKQVVQASLAVGLLTGAAFAVFGPELLVALFGGDYRDGTLVVILLGLTQGVRIAKAGQFAAALAIGSTKLPLIANMARAGSLLAAIGLVSIGYNPVAVAIAGLIGEMASYAIGAHLLATRVRSPVVHQLPQIAAWIVLIVVSFVIGSALRGSTLSVEQFILGLLWLFGTMAIFVALSHHLRDGLIKLFRRDAVDGK